MTGSRGVWRGSARPDRSGQIAGEGQGGVAQDRYRPLETAGVIWVAGPLTEHPNWVQGVENGDGDAPHTRSCSWSSMAYPRSPTHSSAVAKASRPGWHGAR